MRSVSGSDNSNKLPSHLPQRLNSIFHPAFLPSIPAFIFLSFYWDVFITRESVMTHDTIVWYGSFNYFLLCLAQLELPLWDPYSFSGTPFFLEFNGHGMLDPTVLLLVPLIWIWDFSVLDLFHWHYGFLLFIYYAGTYALSLHLSNNKWAALLGAALLLFVVGGNGFRQHGIWSSAVYAPLILLFLLKLISPRTSGGNRKFYFISSCILIGLSLHIYIPSYLFVFLSLAFLYLIVSLQSKKAIRHFTCGRKRNGIQQAGLIFIFIASFFAMGVSVLEGSPGFKLIAVPVFAFAILFLTFRNSYVKRIFLDIGFKNVIAGLALFAVLTAPFFYSLSQVLPNDAENFGYLRADLDSKFNELAHLENNALAHPKETLRYGLDSIAGMLFPFPDLRYFFGGRGMQEAIPVLGIAPLLIVFLFYRFSSSAYKGLCLFMVLSLGFIMGGPGIFYKSILNYFPGLWTVRAVANFYGYFYPIWAALTAICFASLVKEDNSVFRRRYGLIALIFIGFLHAEGIYYYLTTFIPADASKPSLRHTPWLEKNLISHAWFLAAAYGLSFLILMVRYRSVRILSCVCLAFLSIFQAIELCVNLRAFTIQPALYSDKGYVHYNRKFVYKPIRVPVPPRLGTFNSYLPALYRLPTVGPLYGDDYIILNRRIFDYLRVTAVENIGLLSGMGKRRFGFFDRYFLARNSVDALMHVSGSPKEVLKNTLILEESELVESLGHLKKVRALDLPPLNPPKENPTGILTKLYSKFININYLQMESPKDNELFRSAPLPENHYLSNWKWDNEHLGYFLIMTRHLNLTPHYRVLGNSTFIPVSLGSDGKDAFCFSLFQQNGLFKDRDPELSIREQYPYYCALRLREGYLEVNEEYWANVTNSGTFNMNALSPAYPGVTIWALDQKQENSEKSPYARDEETEVLDFGPNHIRFKINNSKSGLFYYADTYSKHWKAWVDGQPTKILKANFNFKAVPVEEGEHIVEFRFEPWIFIIFMLASMLASIPAAALPLLTLFKKD